MVFLVQLAEHFMGMFKVGTVIFLGYLYLLPPIICAVIFFNAISKVIREQHLEKAALICSKFALLRYTLLPVIGLFVMKSPMAFSLGKNLKEEHKPAFYDSLVSFIHPVTSLFPHANVSEIFMYLGIACGVSSLGLSVIPLAVHYFIAGLAIILVRGLVTQLITSLMIKRKRSIQ